MKVAGIAAIFPSRVITNDDILEMIAKESKASYRGDLHGSRALQRVRHLLHYSGIKYRRWSAPNETPIQLLAEAISKAVAEGGCSLSDIDLLIYTGCFIETRLGSWGQYTRCQKITFPYLP